MAENSGILIAKFLFDELAGFVQTHGAKGLAWLAVGEEGIRSSFAKYLDVETVTAIIERMGGKAGDLTIWFVRSKDELQVEIEEMASRLEQGAMWIAWTPPELNKPLSEAMSSERVSKSRTRGRRENASTRPDTHPAAIIGFKEVKGAARIEDKIVNLKNISDVLTRKNELDELLSFLGANPVEKVDNAFKEKYGAGILEYLELN